MFKKRSIVAFSIVVLLMLFVFPTMLLQLPKITPDELLGMKPYITISNLIIIVPSSTIIVYLLGIITIVFGVLLIRKGKDFRILWGLSLIFWGVGTILAGTSYQGFGYELKCNGQDFCLFTSWFELAYLYMTAFSITVMGYAVSLKGLDSYKRDIYLRVISIGFIVYTITLVAGVLFNLKLLITYEWFLIFFLPYFISFFIMNIRSNSQNPSILNRRLINIWLIMLLVNIIYFGYLFSGIPELIYDRYNIWFSANDVLHVGLVPWMYYIYITIKE